MPKRTWEYTRSVNTGHKDLNEMGQNGWEIIYFERGEFSFVLYKRPLVNGVYEYA
jgi:hypothetical protein